MRWIAALPLVLVACDAPLEEFWPVERHVIERDDRTFLVQAKYDPLDYSWFARVSEPGAGLAGDEAQLALRIVEEDLGEKVCDSGRLTLESWWTERLPGGGALVHLPSLGTWQIVASCY